MLGYRLRNTSCIPGAEGARLPQNIISITIGCLQKKAAKVSPILGTRLRGLIFSSFRPSAVKRPGLRISVRQQPFPPIGSRKGGKDLLVQFRLHPTGRGNQVPFMVTPFLHARPQVRSKPGSVVCRTVMLTKNRCCCVICRPLNICLVIGSEILLVFPWLILPPRISINSGTGAAAPRNLPDAHVCRRNQPLPWSD